MICIKGFQGRVVRVTTLFFSEMMPGDVVFLDTNAYLYPDRRTVYNRVGYKHKLGYNRV